MKESLLARLTWLSRNLPRVSLRRSGQLVFVDSDLPSSALNIVFGVPASQDEAEVITRHWLPRNLPATWWLPTDVATPAAWWLAECGWGIEDVLIGMALTMDDGYEINPPETAGLVIKPCDSFERVRDMAMIVASLYGEDRMREGALIGNMIERQAEVVVNSQDGFKAWVAYSDGQPVSTVVLYSSGDSADLSGLATRPEFRHLNFAHTLFFHALAEAKSLGSRLVTLQAASKGVRLYTKLGFAPINQFVLWNNRYLL
jgi:N-acetylglutamate synthase and related acetyltransferases